MGIATPAIERYALGPLMYRVVRHRMAGHVTKLLCHRNIDDTDMSKGVHAGKRG